MIAETRNRLGSQLLEARRKRGWSQGDLANRATPHQSRLSQIEKGLANTTIDTIAAVGDAVGLALVFVPKDHLAEVSKLIGGSGTTKPFPAEAGSVYEEVFIPDATDDNESEHGST